MKSGVDVNLSILDKTVDANLASTYTMRGKGANNEKLPTNDGDNFYKFKDDKFDDVESRFSNNAAGTSNNFEIKSDKKTVA